MCCVIGGIFMVFGVGSWRYCKRTLFGIEESNPAEWRLTLDDNQP